METYQYELLSRLCFPRFGGTDGELRAARLIQAEIAALGGQSELMPFDIPAYEIDRCAFTAGGRSIACTAMGHSGQFPEGGITLPFRYPDRLSDTLAGCAVMVNSFDLETYQALAKCRAAAVIEIAPGPWYGKQALQSWEMRPEYLQYGQIPVFTIRAGDAMALVREGTETVHLELRQRSFTTISRNVLATLEGSGDTSVLLTAHYDTTSASPGAWDNGSGAVTLLYIYRHFLKYPPKCTMHFVWCGAEEQGLLGSKAYAAACKDRLSSVGLCFNLDSCGTVLGENCIDIAGSETLKALTEEICREAGFPASVVRYVDGSDSAVFANCGIPAVCPGRGHWTSCEAHTRRDTIDTISPRRLHEMGEFSIFYLNRFVNADVFPVERKMPKDMVQQMKDMFPDTTNG